MSTFEERAKELAVANGFQWPLIEEELAIEQVEFHGGDMHRWDTTLKGPNTMKSRMWLEVTLDDMKAIGQINFQCDDLREKAEEFFGEALCAERENHPFIRGVLDAERGVAWLKVGENRPHRA